MPTHAVVWIDHHEARIFHVDRAEAEETTVLAHRYHVHRHPHGRGDASAHPDDDRRFFVEVAGALHDADAILLVGPSSAKLEFFRYLHEHDRRIEGKVVGIETVDHPSDGQVIAMARAAFKLN